MLGLPKDQAARLAAIGAQASAGTLARVWQMLLKNHDEKRRAPDPKAAAVVSALIRLCYAADLPGPEEAIKALRSGDAAPAAGSASAPVRTVADRPSSPGVASVGGSGGGAATARMLEPAPANAPQALASPQTFEDVVALIEAKRDIALKVDVDRFMRPAGASRPRRFITFEFGCQGAFRPASPAASSHG